MRLEPPLEMETWLLWLRVGRPLWAGRPAPTDPGFRSLCVTSVPPLCCTTLHVSGDRMKTPGYLSPTAITWEASGAGRHTDLEKPQVQSHPVARTEAHGVRERGSRVHLGI